MNNKRILVVDDDREFAESMVMRCRSRGWSAQVACTPLAAVQSMVSFAPDLLCLDVHMPTGNGLDLCEYLARGGTGPQKPVVILTGASDMEIVRRSQQLDTRYVQKSTNVWAQLRPVIEQLLAVENSPAQELVPSAQAITGGEDYYD